MRKKWLLIAIGLLIAVLAIGAVACDDDGDEEGEEVAPTATVEEGAAEKSPADLFQQYVDALNRGDIDAVLALFADDAVLSGGFSCTTAPCAGTEAIQRRTELEVALNTRFTIISVEASGDTASGRLESRTDVVRGGGAERLVVLFTVEVTSGKLSSVGVVPDTADDETAAYLGRLLDFALNFDLGPGRDADQSGGASFSRVDEDRTAVVVNIARGPAGEPQPVHVHEGTCADLGAVAYPLTDGLGGVSTMVLDVSLTDLRTGNFAINAHQSQDELGVYVACGDIPAADLS